MTDLNGKVILVTGASSGIGKAIVTALVEAGCSVVGCARNTDRLDEVKKSLKGPGKMICVKCDLTKEEDINNVFKTISKDFGTLHAVVNNAGMLQNAPLLSGKSEDWNKMLQVNVLAVSICAREGIKMMKECKVENGHIINVNSVVGRKVFPHPMATFYSATKFAVTALCEGLRQELRAEKSHIRVTAISPGYVQSELYERALPGNKAVADGLLSQFEVLKPEDVAQGIIYALSAPSRVDVNEVIMRSYEQEF